MVQVRAEVKRNTSSLRGTGFIPPKGQDRVEATEGERVRQRRLYLGGPGVVGDDVEVALGVGRGEVGGGRQQAVPEGEQRGDAFERTGGAQRVPVHRLRGTDGQPVGVRAEDLTDRLRLHRVVGQRAR